MIKKFSNCNISLDGLEIFSLNENAFDDAFSLLKTSFPSDEMRDYEGQKNLLSDPDYNLFGLREQGDNRLIGLISVWLLDDFGYIEHLATAPEYRCKGLGKTLLNTTINALGVPVCLEVEKPETDLTRRRIAFYERNGFTLNAYDYVQPAYSPSKKPVPLLLMTTGGGVTQSAFEKIKKSLYTRVYKIKN